MGSCLGYYCILRTRDLTSPGCQLNLGVRRVPALFLMQQGKYQVLPLILGGWQKEDRVNAQREAAVATSLGGSYDMQHNMTQAMPAELFLVEPPTPGVPGSMPGPPGQVAMRSRAGELVRRALKTFPSYTSRISVGLKAYRSYLLISYHVTPHHIISYHVISYHIISYHIISYHIISYHIISYHVMSCHVMSCHVMSCHVMSCRSIPSCIVLDEVVLSSMILYHIML